MIQFLKISLIFLFSFNFLSAAELDNYLKSAYEGNSKLNAERQNFSAINENKNISRSKFLPNLTISGDISDQNSTNRTNSSGSSLSDTNLQSETRSYEITQKIFDGFQGINNYKKSELEVEQAKIKLKSTEQSVMLDALNAYYDLYYKGESLKFYKENNDLFERQVETDRARLQRGEISLTDLAQSESSLAGAYANLIRSETEYVASKENFIRVIGTEVPEIVSFVDFKLNLPNNLVTALQESEKNNPGLLISQIDYLISEKDLNIERAGLSPSATLSFKSSESSGTSSTVDDQDQETVKATVTWPIFKGGENLSTIKKAKYKVAQYKLLYEDNLKKNKTDTSNSWSKFQSFQSVLKSTEAQVKAAEIANEGITLEYETGKKRTTLEVIQSRTLLLNAKINLAKAQKDYMISKFELMAIIGRLTFDNLTAS